MATLDGADLIILDVWLSNSKLDGIELLREFKHLDSKIPIIIISGPEFIVKVENINEAEPIKNIPNIEIHLVPNLSDNLPENGLIIAIKNADEISNNPDTFVLYSNT